MNHVCCQQRWMSPSSRSKQPALHLSCFSSLLPLFFLPDCCHHCDFFCTISCALNMLRNAVSFFIVVTSTCQITGVIYSHRFPLHYRLLCPRLRDLHNAQYWLFIIQCASEKKHHRYTSYGDILFFACVLSICAIHTSFDDLSMSVMRG